MNTFITLTVMAVIFISIIGAAMFMGLLAVKFICWSMRILKI